MTQQRFLLARAVPPATEPLTLAEAKLYLRVDGSEEDAAITGLIATARIAAEEYLCRSLITQTWKLSFNDCAPEEVQLPRGPVQSVTSVVLFARDGSSATQSAATYYLAAAQDVLRFDAQAAAHRVEITYVAGYGSSADMPRPIRQGMLNHIAAMYDHRGEADASLPRDTIALYAPFREARL